MKRTKQREIIMNVIERMKREKLHYKVEDVYLLLKKEGYSVNLSTIYRNFNELVEKGVLLKFLLSDGTAIYDANVFRHAHFRCLRCGKIEDLMLEEIGFDFKEDTFREKGIKLSNISVVFEGICSDCLEENKLN